MKTIYLFVRTQCIFAILGQLALINDLSAEEIMPNQVSRTWTSFDGRFTLNASLVNSEIGEVTLKRSNGTRVRVKTNQLSLDDQTFVTNHARVATLPDRRMFPPERFTDKNLVGDATAPTLESMYRLEMKPVRRVRATLDYCVTAPNYKISNWVVFMPGLPTYAHQRDVVTRTTPQADVVHERHGLKRPVLRALVDNDGLSGENYLPIKIEYTAQLYSRRLVRTRSTDLAPESAVEVKPLTSTEKRLYQAESTRMNYRSTEVKRWMDRNSMWQRDDEHDINFGRRVYETVWHTMDYVYREKQYRRASQVCSEGLSDCGGLSALIVALLRANEIPSRLLVGRWAVSEKSGELLGGEVYRKQHIISEFYVDRVGWIPMDIASGIVCDRKNFGRKYFGREEGVFLTMHVDSDIQLDTIYFGTRRINALQSPAFWAKGAGNLENATVEESWNIEEIE